MSEKKYFPIEQIPIDARIRNSIFTSLLFPPNAPVRQGDLQMEVISTNDKRNTVTFELKGIWLEPKSPDDAPEVEAISEPEEPVIIAAGQRKIIKL